MTIMQLALSYLAFLTLLGTESHTQKAMDQIPHLFAETIVKEENGAVIVKTREALVKQLTSAHRAAYPFTIESKDIMCDEGARKASVRFVWTSEKLGQYITSATLTFDEQNKIKAIQEVFNKVNIQSQSAVQAAPAIDPTFAADVADDHATFEFALLLMLVTYFSTE